MKRLILLVSVLGLSFILTACGGSGEQKEPSKSQNLINMNTNIMKY